MDANDALMQKEIRESGDVLPFLMQFGWWKICRTNSGGAFRIEIAVRLKVRIDNSNYLRLQSRKDESYVGVAERLRQSIVYFLEKGE